MAGFLYFADGKRSADLHTPQQVIDSGLAYAIKPDESPLKVDMPNGGPSGKGGLLFASTRRMTANQMKFATDEQAWLKMPGKDIWVGFDKEDKPGPAELLRLKTVNGRHVKLEDGHNWLIPEIRITTIVGEGENETQEFKYGDLPFDWGMDHESGKWTRRGIQASFLPALETAEKWSDIRFEALRAVAEQKEPPTVLYSDIFDSAVQMLGVNYEVGPVEVELLGLLRTIEIAESIMDITIDYKTFIEHLKKKTACAAT